MKKHFWGIWQGRGFIEDGTHRPLVFSRLLDAKVWMISNPNARARIVKCHIEEVKP